MKTVRSHIVIISIVLCLANFSSKVWAAPSDYTLQTLYIFNFTKYVEWPTGNRTVKIGVVDNDSAEEYLGKMAKAKSTGSAEIDVVNTKNEIELGSCQIIFVPSNNTHLAAKLIERFSSQPILIITEDPDLTRKGASVSFKLVSGKLRFQINEEAIKSRGLKVSNSLITLAEK
jgi:YfiR/HmsC-like